jgi:transposase
VQEVHVENEPKLYVGIDFSRNQADFAVHRADGRALLKHRSFGNHRSGYQAAKTLLLEMCQKHGTQRLAVGGEATSYYWLPMYLQLAQDAELGDVQLDLYLLNARWVHWYKKMSSPNHKDDRIDPGAIADYLRFKQPDTGWQYDERWLPVRFLTRLRFHLAKQLTREKNLFQLYLFLQYNSYAHRKPFSDSLGTTSRVLIRDPQLVETFQKLSDEDQTDFLDQLSNHHLPDPSANAQRLRQVLAERIPVAAALAGPIQFGLELLLDTIEHLEAQIVRVEKHIEALVVEAYPEIAWLDSIPGIGPVIASGVAAEIGNLDRFLNQPRFDPQRQAYRQRTANEVQDAVHKYAGLWWPKNASGQFEAEEHRMSREGNAYLRFYVLEAADRLRQHIPSFSAYYKLKYDQANKHKHKRALVLTGSKALDLFVTLLRRREVYRAKEGDRLS